MAEKGMMASLLVYIHKAVFIFIVTSFFLDGDNQARIGIIVVHGPSWWLFLSALRQYLQRGAAEDFRIWLYVSFPYHDLGDN